MSTPGDVRQPIVLGVHLHTGWAEADLPRRVAAALCLPLVAVLLLMQAGPSGNDVVVVPLLAATVGPPCFYSAARVLRPHVGRSRERCARHWTASTSTALGTATLIQMGVGEQAVSVVSAVPAFLGLVVTVPWGLFAALVRASDAWAATSSWPSGSQLPMLP